MTPVTRRSGKLIVAADLFCGAGGTSTGLIRACESAGYRIDLLAINHWDVAIATHLRNHPDVRHLCESLDSVNPRHVVPSGKLDMLVASPECTHHSIARGGKPINEQSRASAWHILRWCEALRIENVLIENVKEFQTWGPLGSNGRPLQSMKGKTYIAFLNALTSLGYNVDARVLNAADYGDPTTRKRLFVLARRGRKPIVWPEPSHGQRKSAGLFEAKKPWRSAREIIDWSIPSKSLSERKRPLSPNTMRRIAAGLRKFGGKAFVVSWDQTGGGGVCEAFLIHTNHHGGDRVHSIENPVPTVTGAHRGELALVEPFLVKYNATGGAMSVDEPLDTVTARDRFGLVIPDGMTLDIRFRMLQPHELARAQGFPDEYEFTGTREQIVKQIGNAVPVNLAEALCRRLIA